MELNEYVASLRSALAAAGQAASDDVREAADRLSYAVEPSLRLTLIEALSDAADEINTQIDGVSIEVRMRGGNPDFVASDDRFTSPEAEPGPPTPPEPPEQPTDDSISRISLRLPESLKTRAEAAAAGEGISVNAWIARAISTVLDAPQQPFIDISSQGVRINPAGRARLSGWAR